MTDFLFLCECSAPSCRETLFLDEETYGLVAYAGCVVVASGHQQPGEEIVRRGDGFLIVVDNEGR